MSGSFSDQYRQPRPAWEQSAIGQEVKGQLLGDYAKYKQKHLTFTGTHRVLIAPNPGDCLCRPSVVHCNWYNYTTSSTLKPPYMQSSPLSWSLSITLRWAVPLWASPKLASPGQDQHPGMLVLGGVSTPRVSQGYASLTPIYYRKLN